MAVHANIPDVRRLKERRQNRLFIQAAILRSYTFKQRLHSSTVERVTVGKLSDQCVDRLALRDKAGLAIVVPEFAG